MGLLLWLGCFTGLFLSPVADANGRDPQTTRRLLAQSEWTRSSGQDRAVEEAPAASDPNAGQNSPAVSIDALRQGGVEGFAAAEPSPVFIRTEHHGNLHAGWALPLDPGEQIEFELAHEDESNDAAWSRPAPAGRPIQRVETIDFELRGGKLSTSTSGRFRLIAPRKPGNYPFRIKVSRRLDQDGRRGTADPAEQIELIVLVKTPFDRNGNGLIGDYPMGIYPNEKGRSVSGFVQQHRELYIPPESFILATAGAEALHLSRHFTLGEFVPPMDRGERSYVAVDPRLVQFLERAIDDLRPQIGQGGGPKPLRILNAFLSPNQLMQFEARGVELTLFTRYQYGDAAAIIWDADGDGKMDDLTRDGVVDIEDARRFADLLSEVQRSMGKFGGIGVESGPQLPFMPPTPYVDVDMRGVATRW